MKAYLAPTDREWAQFLSARPTLTEANFWLPKPVRTYGLQPLEPLLFKSKKRDGNRIIGGGVLSDYRVLPLSLAWSAFGEQNGCAEFDDMLRLLSHYRRGEPTDAETLIGCVMLRETAFFPPAATIPAPSDFPLSNPGPKGYQLGAGAPPEIEAAYVRLLAAAPGDASEIDFTWTQDGPMFGSPGQRVPRLGQSAFAAVVGNAYGMRCAITGNKVRPILQAAHIRPVAKNGQHRVDNGLLLRADVHIMFDRGYLGVHPEKLELMVSPSLRTSFGNGEEFYSLNKKPIDVPRRPAERPNREFLQWHLDTTFGKPTTAGG